MKKVYIAQILTFFLIVALKAQPLISYENHALQANQNHNTVQTEYVEPGKSGENQKWDFSELVCTGNKVSSLYDANEITEFDIPMSANVAVKEGENFFFFDVNNYTNQYLGLANNNSYIEYTTPAQKMRYPFTYGENFEGEFAGTGIYHGSIESQVQGTYKVKADGYGTLILPNGVFHNVLRIKSITKTIEVMYCNTTETETKKYLWYSPESRYPIFVVTKSDIASSNEGDKAVKQAFYIDKVVRTINEVHEIANVDYNFSLYPNPYANKLNIEYVLTNQATVSIEVFDVLGNKVHTILSEVQQKPSKYNYKFSAKNQNLTAGVYYIRLVFNNKTYLEKVVEVK